MMIRNEKYNIKKVIYIKILYTVCIIHINF